MRTMTQGMYGSGDRKPPSTAKDGGDPSCGDILCAIGKGELTPEEGDRIAAIVDKRVGLFATVELQGEIGALKS